MEEIRKNTFVKRTTVVERYMTTFYNNVRKDREPTIEIIKEINTNNMPQLNKDDNFYFEDENRIVKILDVCKTDKNNVIYIIEDEEYTTLESLKQCELEKNESGDIQVLKAELRKAIELDDYDKIKALLAY